MKTKNQNTSTLAANILQGIESRIKDIHTAMPGIIVSFDPETQTASIQPAIKRVFKTQEEDTEVLTPTDLPILINVPVVQPRGGGYSMTFPIGEGDECLLVFCERSIDYWHEKSGMQLPGARRFHHLSDATAFVGLSSIPNKIANYTTDGIEIKKDDGTTSIKIKTGVIGIVSDQVNITGSSVKHNGTEIGDTHIHEGSPTAPTGGVSDTGVPQ